MLIWRPIDVTANFLSFLRSFNYLLTAIQDYANEKSIITLLVELFKDLIYNAIKFAIIFTVCMIVFLIFMTVLSHYRAEEEFYRNAIFRKRRSG